MPAKPHARIIAADSAHALAKAVSETQRCRSNDHWPPLLPVSALESGIAEAPVAAALLDPFQITERAVILVLVIGVDAGLQAGLSGRLA